MVTLRALCCWLIAIAAVLSTAPVTAKAEPIMIEHERGTLTLDGPAKRVAVTNWAFTETLIALGLDPVAIADPDDYRTWVAKPELQDTFIDIGQRASPNEDALRQVKPDLILISNELEMAYENLSEIAPVMVLSVYADDRNALESATDMMMTVARATGLEDAANDYLINAQSAFDEYGARVRAVLGAEQPINVVSFYDEAAIGVFGPPSLPGAALAKMGVPLAHQGDVNKWGFARGGMEILAPYGANALVYTNPVPNAVRKKVWASPMWKVMGFVRNDRVYELPVVWTYGAVPSAVRFAKLLAESLESGPVQK